MSAWYLPTAWMVAATLVIAAGSPGVTLAESEATFPAADARAESGRPAWSPDFDAQGQLVASALWLGPEDHGPFNPGNLIAGVPERALSGEARFNIRMKTETCDGLLKPRLRWTRTDRGGSDESETEPFFNTALFRCQLPANFEASFGRQVLQWGNGQFRSPANPFFAESVRFNPVQEIMGKDFIVLAYQPGYEWRAAYFAHLDDSHLDASGREFLRAHAGKLDWVGSAAVAGAVVSQRHGRPIRLSGYGTLTWSESTLLYGEATVSRDAEGRLPVLSDSGVVGMLSAAEVDDRRRYSVLLGFAYTFNNGTTVYGEYLRSTEGFSDGQADQWLELARRASAELGGAGVAEAATQLGAAIDPGWRQLRNDYLFVQWVRTEYRNRFDLAARLVRNLDDRSTEVSGTMTLSINERTQWFIVGARFYGGAETEFGRLQRYAVQTGFRFYAF